MAALVDRSSSGEEVQDEKYRRFIKENGPGFVYYLALGLQRIMDRYDNTVQTQPMFPSCNGQTACISMFMDWATCISIEVIPKFSEDTVKYEVLISLKPAPEIKGLDPRLRMESVDSTSRPIDQITTPAELERIHELCKLLLLFRCIEGKLRIRQAGMEHGILDFTVMCILNSASAHLNLLKQLYYFRFIVDLRDRDVFVVLKFAEKKMTLPKVSNMPEFFEAEKRFACVQEFAAFVDSCTRSVKSLSDLKCQLLAIEARIEAMNTSMSGV